MHSYISGWLAAIHAGLQAIDSETTKEIKEVNLRFCPTLTFYGYSSPAYSTIFYMKIGIP